MMKIFVKKISKIEWFDKLSLIRVMFNLLNTAYYILNA